jgi:hypothetical protein
MRALKKQYGPKKGEEIYYALEQKEKKKGKRKSGARGSDPISRAVKGK